MTGSRGGLIALAILFFLPIMYSRKNKFIKIIFISLIALICIFLIAPMILPENIYLRLFTSSSYETTISSSKNRVAIWSYCIEYLLPKMSWNGFGAGTPPYLIGRNFGMNYRSIHNTYLCMFLEFGIIMLPIFIGLIYIGFKDLKRKQDYIGIAGVIGTCIMIFFLDGYFRTYFWNLMVYFSLGYKLDWREEYRNEKFNHSRSTKN